MKRYWYRVSITARYVRSAGSHQLRVKEMIGDVEAVSTYAAIALAKHTHRVLIERVYQRKGRRFTAECLGTTEEIVNAV